MDSHQRKLTSNSLLSSRTVSSISTLDNDINHGWSSVSWANAKHPIIPPSPSIMPSASASDPGCHRDQISRAKEKAQNRFKPGSFFSPHFSLARRPILYPLQIRQVWTWSRTSNEPSVIKSGWYQLSWIGALIRVQPRAWPSTSTMLFLFTWCIMFEIRGRPQQERWHLEDIVSGRTWNSKSVEENPCSV